GDGAGAGGGVDRRPVGPVVVEPPNVATDVDGGAGDVDGGEAVAATAVHPRRLEAGAAGPRLPPGGGVTQPVAVVAAGADDDEVAAVGRHVDVAHLAVEARFGALRVVAVGLPVGDLGRVGAEVDHGDLDPALTADGLEVAPRHEGPAVGADDDRLHPGRGALVGVGEGDVEVGVEGAGGGVDAGQAAPGLVVDGGEVPDQVDLRPGQG